MKLRHVLLPLLLITGVPALMYSQFTLDSVESKIARDYPITHLPVDTLKTALAGADSSSFLLFDVREKAEFDTSHIAGAIQVDPDLSAEDFIRHYGKRISTKHLVFYCSVGKRSSILAERVEAEALKLGAADVENLRGGIFRWYNDGYPVVDAQGETNAVHPYDDFWGQLLQKRTVHDKR